MNPADIPPGDPNNVPPKELQPVECVCKMKLTRKALYEHTMSCARFKIHFDNLTEAIDDAIGKAPDQAAMCVLMHLFGSAKSRCKLKLGIRPVSRREPVSVLLMNDNKNAQPATRIEPVIVPPKREDKGMEVILIRCGTACYSVITVAILTPGVTMAQ